MSWPRSLFGRLMLILLVGLISAQGLTFWLVMTERGEAMQGMMVPYLAADVASSVAMLDRLPPAERSGWLPRLQRGNYRLVLAADPSSLPASIAVPEPVPTTGPVSVTPLDRGPVLPPGREAALLAEPIAVALGRALGQPVAYGRADEAGVDWRFRLRLADGTPLAVDVLEARMRLSPWVIAALALQLALLVVLAWLAVRQVTRPLQGLAAAAGDWHPLSPVDALPETGPREVARASAAFNRMQRRIAASLDERSQMLGAIAHDLQTPITRLALRADLVDDAVLRDKLVADLAQMQHLVEQGLSYARTARAIEEPRVATDVAALVESLIGDYQDAGEPVRWVDGTSESTRQSPDVPELADSSDEAGPSSVPGTPGAGPAERGTVTTRPRALRRVLTNLVDNAIRFGGAAELKLDRDDGRLVIEVLDRGPGIAEADIDKAMQPFQRLDSSRNPVTGGSGLGLTIAVDLATHCGADLRLAPRPGGGLVAAVRFSR